MAINPSSDLVLDVAQAVDPLEYRASVEKLNRARMNAIGQAGMADGMRFAEMTGVDSSANAAPVTGLEVRSSHKPAEAYRKFEAFMLQTFIQDMFTTDTPSVFGKGQAGEYWKSMMAEMMAKEMAEGGGIGVARMLEARSQLQDAQGAMDKQATINTIVQKTQMAMVRNHLDKG